MSLINDALKRANRARQKNPFNGRPVAPLQPVDYAVGPKGFSRALIGLSLAVSLALSGWFFWKWSRSGAESQQGAAVADKSTASSASTPASPKSVAHPQPIKVSTNIILRTNRVALAQLEAAAQSAATNPPVSPAPTNAAVPTNVPVPPPPSPFADLKLQSIIFRENKPAVVINGEMLVTGDRIRGARILKIEPQSVTVERGGETNELSLRRL